MQENLPADVEASIPDDEDDRSKGTINNQDSVLSEQVFHLYFILFILLLLLLFFFFFFCTVKKSHY